MLRKRGFKFIAGLLLIGFLVALIICVRLAIEDPRLKNPPQRLADGAIWTLAQVNYSGTNIPLNRSTFDRLRSRFIPGGLTVSGHTIVPPIPKTTNYEAYGLKPAWRDELNFRILQSPLAVRGSEMVVCKVEKRWVAFDEFGDECQYLPDIMSFFPVTTNAVVFSYALPAFPRRGKFVGLRMLQKNPADQWQPTAEFFIPNPSPPPHPRWVAAALPQTQRVEGLEFSIDNVAVAPYPRTVSKPYDTLNARATIRITQNGQPTEEWLAHRVMVSDATGNHFSTVMHLVRSNSTAAYGFESPLDPNEIWKIRVEFARQKGIPAEDLRRLQVPRPERRGSRLETKVNGTGITAYLTGGPDVKYREVAIDCLVLKLAGQTRDVRPVVINASNEAGRSLPDFEQYYSRYYGVMAETDYFYYFPESSTKDWLGLYRDRSLEITIGIQKSIYVEFTVQPKRNALTNGVDEFPAFAVPGN